MRLGIFRNLCVGLALVGLSACVSTSKTKHAFAPLPPKNSQVAGIMNPSILSNIQPALGYQDNIQLSQNAKKSCSFSSFHRRNTIGYEFDESRHIAFKASPKVDVFNPDDAEVEFSLRFTKSFGGKANKRPDCTYGSGFYGQLPFLVNDGVETSSLNMTGVKSYVQERLDIREQRQIERQKRLSRGL